MEAESKARTPLVILKLLYGGVCPGQGPSVKASLKTSSKEDDLSEHGLM